MREVRVTEISSFLNCRRSWDLKYNHSLVPIDRNKGALWFGTGMHRVIKEYHMGTTLLTALINVFMDYCDETPCLNDEFSVADRSEATDLAIAMINSYVHYAESHDGWEIIEVEKQYSYKGISGTIDMLVKTNDEYWIVDHKNLAKFADTETLELDHQMTGYIWLLRGNGIPVRGCIYNMLRKKIPAEPAVLKTGGLSKAKNIDTTYDAYVQAVRDNELDIADYQEILEVIKCNEFIRRERITRTDAHIESFGEQMAQILWDMQTCSSLVDPQFYPNPTRDCIWMCSYKSICRTMQDKADHQLVIDTFFEKGSAYDNQEVSNENL